MILYLAGGFHFSNTLETEGKLAEHLIENYGKYQRLATFFYEKDAKNIIFTVEKVNENQETSANS
jgi:outer membrane lipopolysaccharide assembly protein LptE/RlpB